jgi:hypothetical protein
MLLVAICKGISGNASCFSGSSKGSSVIVTPPSSSEVFVFCFVVTVSSSIVSEMYKFILFPVYIYLEIARNILFA